MSALRLKPLESLRGLMALWVLVGHILAGAGIWSHHWPMPFRLIGQGQYPVDVFIILSGFVIFNLLSAKSENYWQFLERRAWRLLPVWFFCLFFSIPLRSLSEQALRLTPFDDGNNLQRLAVFISAREHFVFHLISHLTLTHGLFDAILPYSAGTFIAPGWSLSVEWQFYVFAPVLFILFSKKNRKWLFIFIALMIAGVQFTPGWNFSLLTAKLPYFFVGMVSFFVWKGFNDPNIQMENNLPKVLGAWESLFWPMGMGLIILLTWDPALIIWAGIFLAMIGKNFNSSRMEQYFLEKLSSPSLLWLGKISYPLYLIHLPLIYITLYFLVKTHLNKVGYLAVMILVIPLVSILFAALLNRWIEQPAMAFGSRWMKRKN